jgi:hypothetical protein
LRGGASDSDRSDDAGESGDASPRHAFSLKSFALVSRSWHGAASPAKRL